MGPIGKFADSDGAFARANSAARVGLVGIGAGTQFIGVADLIIVRISGGPHSWDHPDRQLQSCKFRCRAD